MRNITVDGQCYYIKNDIDFEEIIYQKCGKEASDWFKEYAKQFDNVIEQKNEMIEDNIELLKNINNEIKEIKRAIEQIYSTKEIVVTEYKRNDNLDKIEVVLREIEKQAEYIDLDEDPIEKDFT